MLFYFQLKKACFIISTSLLFIGQQSFHHQARPLTPSTAPVVLQLTQLILLCICLSMSVFVLLSTPFIPGLFMIMFLLWRWISTMHALENRHLYPCFWSPFHHLSSIHPPSIHCIHPCIYRSIHYHLFINPLLFKRIHPRFRKDKIQRRVVFSSLKLQSLIQISDTPSFFYNKVKKVHYLEVN